MTFLRFNIIVFCIALALRLGLLFGHHDSYKAEQVDSMDYKQIATNLINGKGFISGDGLPTNKRPPVYIVFIASFYKYLGTNDAYIKFFQCVLSAVSVLFLFMICADIFNKQTAILSAIIAACYPPLIIYSNIMLTETLFIFLILAECLMFIKALKQQDNKYLYYKGVLHGISTLCRSTLIFIPVFELAIIALSPGRKKLFKGFVIYLLISSSIISIWTIRNYRTFNVFMPVCAASGTLMWYLTQNNVWQNDLFVEPSMETAKKLYPEINGLKQNEYEPILAHKAMLYALNNPVDYLKKMLINEKQLWFLPVGKVLLENRSVKLASLYKGLFVIAVLLSFAGMIFSCVELGLTAMPVLMYILYIAIVHAPLMAIPRYRLPFEPFMIMFFSYFIVRLINRGSESKA